MCMGDQVDPQGQGQVKQLEIHAVDDCAFCEGNDLAALGALPS